MKKVIKPLFKSVFLLLFLLFTVTQVFAQRGRVSVYDYADKEVHVSKNKHPGLRTVIEIGIFCIGVIILLGVNTSKKEEKKENNNRNNTKTTYHDNDDLPYGDLPF